MKHNSFIDIKKTDEFHSFQIRILLGIYTSTFLGVGTISGFFQIGLLTYISIVVSFFCVSLLLFVDLFRKLESISRRYLTLFLDIFFASWSIYLSVENSAFSWLFYVILLIGHGARYGVKFSNAAALIILIQYNFLLLFTDLWSKIPLDLVSQMVVLALLPFYLNSLFKRLHIAKNEAEKLTMLKSKFLASMTHEIRTPLNGIIGTTRLLENTQPSPLQQKYLNALGYSSRLLHGLIDDILDFSKLEANKLKLNIVEFNLQESILEIVECLTPKCPNTGQSLIANIEDNVPTIVKGDKQRLQQVLVNLVSNALKNTDKVTGKVILNLSAQPDPADKSSVQICFKVIDNGIGIDKNAQKTLFDSYTQFSQSPSSNDDSLRPMGTGLGTAIVKELVEMMGGTIQLKSQKNKGSVFYFSLALSLVDHSSNSTQSTHSRPILESSLHVLVAEDDEINAMVSEQFLKDLGHSVELARDGKEALHSLHQSRYDMIFMDMHMPHASGLQVAQQFRHKNKITPIIGLTANATIEHREACLAAGMSDFLSKPVTPEKLSETIARNMLAQQV